MLVKVSYFPNWHASGADGPWRVTPNLMVVVPTSHDVSLTYGASGADDLGLLATLIGLVRPGGPVRRADPPELEAQEREPERRRAAACVHPRDASIERHKEQKVSNMSSQ